MSIGYAAPEDVINAALREAGYQRAIAEIYEGSRASRVAVEVYGPMRDALLQSQEWDFAFQAATLTATVGGALILGFTNEYDWPATALRIRQVFQNPTGQNNDPQPVRWVQGTDAVLGTKVIWTNISTNPRCAYIAQITDPAKWNPAFTQLFVANLASVFAFALKDDIQAGAARSRIADQMTMQSAGIGEGLSPVLPDLMARAARAATQG